MPNTAEKTAEEAKKANQEQQRARLRTNQRNSRARKQAYLEELERKWAQCVKAGAEATAEMQAAARKVQNDNEILKAMLFELGISKDQIDARLRQAGSSLTPNVLPGPKPCCGSSSRGSTPTASACTPGSAGTTTWTATPKPVPVIPPTAPGQPMLLANQVAPTYILSSSLSSEQQQPSQQPQQQPPQQQHHRQHPQHHPQHHTQQHPQQHVQQHPQQRSQQLMQPQTSQPQLQHLQQQQHPNAYSSMAVNNVNFQPLDNWLTEVYDANQNTLPQDFSDAFNDFILETDVKYQLTNQPAYHQP